MKLIDNALKSLLRPKKHKHDLLKQIAAEGDTKSVLSEQKEKSLKDELRPLLPHQASSEEKVQSQHTFAEENKQPSQVWAEVIEPPRRDGVDNALKSLLSFVAKDESHDKSAEDRTKSADIVNEKALEETLLKDIDLTELKDFLVEKRHELLPPKS